MEAQTPPVDLVIRVITPWGSGGQRKLSYELHSPTGVAPYYRKEIRGQDLHDPEGFKATLFAQLEKLHRGLDVDDGNVLRDEIEPELTALGRRLYEALFPPELRRAYLELRNLVHTVLVVSDEPWIPWELVKPYEDRDDDYLGLQFQLTRWLAGAPHPADLIRVQRLAVFAAGETAGAAALPHAEEERQVLAKWADVSPGVVDGSPEEAVRGELTALLERGDVDLLHFVGHGDFNPGQPDESAIQLQDGPFRPRHLSGPLREGIRQRQPLVFLNACRIGQQGRTLTGLGGWVDTLVQKSGCGAFVAPQWTVGDKLGALFAKIFYRKLHDGKTLGEAAQTTRREMHHENPGELAGLAYVVYGHPNGRLVPGGAALSP